MSLEQQETAEQLAQLSMMPPAEVPDVVCSTTSSSLVQEVCKADMDNTLKLMLEDEVFLDPDGCNGSEDAAALTITKHS